MSDQKRQERLDLFWDFDGLFVKDRSRAYLDYLAQVKGWKVDLSAFRIAGSWTAATGRQRDETTAAYSEFAASSFAAPLVPIVHAGPVMQALANTCTLHLATSRAGTALLEAKKVIASHGVPFASCTGGCFGTKLGVMRDGGFSVLIDDNPHEADVVVRGLQPGEDRYVIQFPSLCLYSRRIDHPNVIRLPICDQALEMVEADAVISEEIQDLFFKTAWKQAKEAILTLAATRSNVCAT